MKIKINIKPLSTNKAWQGKRFKTKEYKMFETQMLFSLPKLEQPPKFEKIGLVFGFSSKLSDIDNPLKMTIDCIVKRYGVDDRNLKELNVKKVIVPKGEEFISILLE